MKFPGAPYGLKMACGENPKRVYGSRNSAPSDAHGQRRRLPPGVAGGDGVPRQMEARGATAARIPAKQPERNLQLETLAGVLDGEIRVHIHCYRADEMATMIDLAKEFGFKIASFHHAVEAYKIRDLLAAERHLRRACGPTGGASSSRRSTASARTSRSSMQAERLRHRPLRHRQRHPAPEPGGGQGDARRASRRASRSSRATRSNG